MKEIACLCDPAESGQNYCFLFRPMVNEVVQNIYNIESLILLSCKAFSHFLHSLLGITGYYIFQAKALKF